MAEQQSIRTIIGYTYDRASAAGVIAGSKEVANSLQSVVTVSKQLDGSTPTPAVEKLNNSFANLKPRIASARSEIVDMRQALTTYGASIDTADKSTVSWISDLQKLRGEIEGVKAAGAGGLGGAGVTGAASAGGSGGGGNGNAIRLLGSNLRALPSVQIPGLGIGTDSIANVIRMAGALNEVAQAVPGVTAATNLLTPAIGATAASMAAMLIPVAAVAVAIAPLIIAFKILADREAEAAKSAKLLADVYASQTDAFAIGQRAIQDRNEETEKAAVDLFDSLNESFRTNVERIAFLRDKQKTSDEKTAAEIQKTIDSTVEEQIKLAGSIDILRGNLNQLGVVIDGVAPGLSKVADGTNNFFTRIIGALAQLDKDVHTKLDPFIEKLRESAEIAKKRADAEVKTVDKLNSDLANIDKKAAEGRIAINEHLADTLIGINAKALENEQKILDDLQKQQANSARKLSRDNESAAEKENFAALGRQIAYQREVVESQKKLDTELRRLREDAAAQEFEDGLDRNFAQIAANRRNLQRNIARTNEDFNIEQTARLKNLKDKNDDADRQYLFEREQRQKAYAQQGADAIEAAKQALAQNEVDRKKARAIAQQAAQNDYVDLLRKIANERQTRINAAIAELQIITQTEAAKQLAYKASLKQAQDLLNGIIAAGNKIGAPTGTGSNVTPRAVATRAGGGGLGVGQSSYVNEFGSSGFESFTNSHGSMNFPGFGIFTPLGSGGTVNSNNRALNVTIPVTVQGGDPSKIAATMTQVARNVVADAIERMNRR